MDSHRPLTCWDKLFDLLTRFPMLFGWRLRCTCAFPGGTSKQIPPGRESGDWWWRWCWSRTSQTTNDTQQMNAWEERILLLRFQQAQWSCVPDNKQCPRDNRSHQTEEDDKIAMIILSHTGVQPWTVVVKLAHTPVTLLTMPGPKWLLWTFGYHSNSECIEYLNATEATLAMSNRFLFWIQHLRMLVFIGIIVSLRERNNIHWDEIKAHWSGSLV